MAASLSGMPDDVGMIIARKLLQGNAQRRFPASDGLTRESRGTRARKDRAGRPASRAQYSQAALKLVATLARSLQADMQELRKSNARRRPVPATPAAASRPNRRRRSVLFRGKVYVRRCRLVFPDCGAGTGGGLAA